MKHRIKTLLRYHIEINGQKVHATIDILSICYVLK